jgi:predicted transcriptional regulator
MNVDSEPIEFADEIGDRLDEAAEAIPRSILLLRKIA